MFDLNALMFARFAGRVSKKKSKTKQPKSNWFERLTVEELKKLCKAAKLPISGAKGVLLSRLLESDATGHFGSEARAASFTYHGFSPGKEGVSVDDLKESLKRVALSATGSKLTLVERLLHHTHGTGGPEGPKRAATVATNSDGSVAYDAQGHPVLKQRKPSTARPNVAKILERMDKKINPPAKTQDKWSNNKYKQHAGDVCVLAAGIVAAEAAKGFAAARDPVLFDACEAAIEPIVDGWNDLTGHGYCRFALQGVLQEVEDALQGSQDVEDTFAARGREVRELCNDLKAKYRRHVGESIDSDDDCIPARGSIPVLARPVMP